MHCLYCGQDLECELETLDEFGMLELYHCYECDVFYTKRAESLSYIHNARKVLSEVAEDLELNKSMWQDF